MLVAISQRQDKNRYGDLFDSLENSYVGYLEKFGITLLVIPNSSKNLHSYFKIPIKSIILTGGNSPNPDLYGGKIKEGDFSKQRDSTEKMLLEIAIEKKLPVLGICRGMQLINIFFGGKIVNLKDNSENVVKHTPIAGVKANHRIEISDKEIAKVLGRDIEVNSYHNYGVTKPTLSAELRSFAQGADGTIEGIYHPALPIAGIQWHPERKSPNNKINEKIIMAFIKRSLFWK